MKRILFIAVFLLCGFVTSSASSQGGPEPFHATGGSGQLDTYIEEQNDYSDCCTIVPPAITNPYPGTYWDVNDHFNEGFSGYVDPGTVSVFPIQIVWDPNPLYSCRPTCNWWNFTPYGKHFYTLSVTANSSSLLVHVCFTPQNRCFDPQPVWNGLARSKALWTWTFHGRVVYQGNPLDPVVQEIPDSNGGIGVLSEVTGTITNTSGSRIKNVTAGQAISSDVFGPCSSEAPCSNLVSEYPFTWFVS